MSPDSTLMGALTGLPSLEILQLLPLIVGGVIFFIPQLRLALTLSVSVGVVELGIALLLLSRFDPALSAFSLVSRVPVVGPLAYHAGIDGLSLLFLLLAVFLFLMVVVYGALVRRFRPLNRFLGGVLVMESLVVGQLVTLDLLWFTLLSLGQTLLAGHLLRAWATSSAEGPAVMRYYHFMGIGLLLLFAATLLLGWHHAASTHGPWRFDLPALAAGSLSPAWQSVIFFLLLYGFAIRVPLFPFHAWLPQVAEHGTVASGMAILLGVKTGVFGIFRFLLPLVPDAVWEWHRVVVVVAAAGIFYSALLALSQSNLRRLMAYAVVSHTSIVIIGLFSLESLAFQGAALLTINFGLAVSTLLFTLGIVHLRTGTMLLPRLGALFEPLPWVSVAFLVGSLAVAGMPGTPGFDAAHLVLEATTLRLGALVTITAALGNVAAVSCLLWAFQRAFLAAPDSRHQRNFAIARATPAETVILAVMVLVQVVVGFHSEPWFKLVDQASLELAGRYHHRHEGE
ncbi:MAG: NADH-quinone oxidoreductase subunit L [Magnetococcales bacterium]|nr:NADH-quinone oxidoreductase subunit L [Magnetococcales bacterium]MBF0156441.1 NADH-quinone oxidoreductase subunit L [Magnetococcales bacterium]